MNLEPCLPAHLRGPVTTFTRMAAGLSGAAVYRVDAGGQAFVLKVAAADEPLADWRRKLRVQELAASEGLAPRVVHSDEERRAVVSAFVADRSFPAAYADSRTRQDAVALLGRTLRLLHDLPLPPDAVSKDPRELLSALWSGRVANLEPPAFVGDAVRRVLAEASPIGDRALVLSHNDVNPSNLVYDGERLLLLDWDTAGQGDRHYDLATIAVFLRMDEPTCLRLLAAHDGAAVVTLPDAFAYGRRLVAVLCGCTFLHLARLGGYESTTGEQTLASVPSLGELYQRMRRAPWTSRPARGAGASAWRS